MPQEDKFKREIDRIGLMLARLIGLIMNKPFNYEAAERELMQQTSDEMQLDIFALLQMSDDDTLHLLTTEKKFSNEHLYKLASIFYEMSVACIDETKRSMLRQKAAALYQYIHQHANGTIYLDAVYRLQELRGA